MCQSNLSEYCFEKAKMAGSKNMPVLKYLLIMPNCLRVDYALVSLHNSHWYCTFVGAGVVLALQLYLYWHCTCVGIALVLFLSSYLYWYCYCASLWRIVYLSLIIFQHSTIGKEMMDDLSEQQHFIGISFHAYCFDVMLITILTFILLSLSLSLSLLAMSHLFWFTWKKLFLVGTSVQKTFVFSSSRVFHSKLVSQKSAQTV